MLFIWRSGVWVVWVVGEDGLGKRGGMEAGRLGEWKVAPHACHLFAKEQMLIQLTCWNYDKMQVAKTIYSRDLI